jgi:AcrR family transcriptional regulator
MPRPPDPARREQLLQASVDYAIEHGLADLTLRPLADALGVAPNSLVHHFGSKEDLIHAILNGVRDRLRQTYAEAQDAATGDPLASVWRWSSHPDRLAFFRSFFEAYGLALHQPERHESFLTRVVGDWIDAAAPADRSRATLELALLRGLLLDLLTTNERRRIERALALYSKDVYPHLV